MILQVGVKILIKNEAGKFLLGKRDPSKYPEVNLPKWDIIGGRIEPGIGLLDNLRREVKEEAAMEIVGEPKLIAAQDILRVPGRHVVRLTYLGQARGEPKVSEEHLDLRWFSPEEMRSLTIDEIDIYLKELLEKNLFD